MCAKMVLGGSRVMKSAETADAGHSKMVELCKTDGRSSDLIMRKPQTITQHLFRERVLND